MDVPNTRHDGETDIRPAAGSGAAGGLTVRAADAIRELADTVSWTRGRLQTGLDELGRLLRSDYDSSAADHQAWVVELVNGLARDGLIAVHEQDGETRVSLP